MSVALAFQLSGIAANTPTTQTYLEEVSKLVDLSQTSSLFQKSNEEEKAEIHQWISFSNGKIDLPKLDQILVSKSYLVGQRFSIADVLVFAAIHDQKSVEAAVALTNVARWFDHIQHRVVAGVVPTQTITHRNLILPFIEATGSTTEAKKEDKKEEKKGAAAVAAPTENKKEEGKKEKKEKKAEDKPAAAAAPAAEKKEAAAPAAAGEEKPASADGLDPSKLEIKVGLIVKCWNHPESDKLLCEEIDLGEGSNRTIASGLRAHYTAEEMQGKKVLVLANLKERPMAGFKSQGMVLCAIGNNHSVVKVLDPPSNAVVGDRIDIAGFSGEPAQANQVAKKKIFESLAPFVSFIAFFLLLI